MIYFSRIFIIKEGYEPKFLNWVKEIEMRRDEALSTFEHEGITRETFTVFNGVDGRTYVIISNEAEKEPLPGDPTILINQQHTAIKKECLESISSPGKVILDLIICE